MNKQYKKLDTYYYDYHVLQISLETSKIMLDSLKLELNYEKECGADIKSIEYLENKIRLRKELINNQTLLLKSMKQNIEDFPKTLKGAEYNVYYLSVVKQKTVQEIALTLGYTSQWVRELRSKMINNFVTFIKNSGQAL